jgi:hypothetical protein
MPEDTEKTNGSEAESSAINETSNERLVFNGVNGSTGEYLLSPMSLQDFTARIVAQGVPDEDVRDELTGRNNRSRTGVLGTRRGVDGRKLEEAGWGIVFPSNMEAARVEAILDSLHPLLEHRKKAACRQQERYQVYSGDEYGVRPGQTIRQWVPRAASKVGKVISSTDGADPDIVPYFLLLIGSPQEIPNWFQYQLDVVYAVGRLYFEPLEGEKFEDTLQRYTNYANNVVAAENGLPLTRRKAAFFGTANESDQSTGNSSRLMVGPLAAYASKNYTSIGWDVEHVLPEKATKATLHGLINSTAPAFLFTASHGMGLNLDDPRMPRHQGALVCQDWPGPERVSRKKITEDYYFSADDVAQDAPLGGLVAFCFGCYSCGTPTMDTFPKYGPASTAQIAPQDILSRLPQRMLGIEHGAIAVVGHIDRVWEHSFIEKQTGTTLQSFEDTVAGILAGEPVGFASEPFNVKFAALSAQLIEPIKARQLGENVDLQKLAIDWTAHNDARNYVILGDPASRICFKTESEGGQNISD